MKTAAIYNMPARTALRYPNAADHRKLVAKFVDLLLVTSIGAGCAAIVLFLAVLV